MEIKIQKSFFFYIPRNQEDALWCIRFFVYTTVYVEIKNYNKKINSSYLKKKSGEFEASILLQTCMYLRVKFSMMIFFCLC